MAALCLKPHETLQCEAMLSATIAAPLGIGVIIRTNNTAMEARAQLYEYRKQAQNPEYTNIQIRFSPDDPDNDLWCLRLDPESIPV